MADLVKAEPRAEPRAEPNPDPVEVKISHHAKEILKITRDTEFLQSFLRVDHGDTDSEAGDYGTGAVPGAASSAGPGAGASAGQKGSGCSGSGDERADGEGGDRAGQRATGHSGQREEPRRPRHKATFKEVVKELELSYGLGALASKKGRRGKSIRGEEVYTDKDRAAAVQMGHRDIKQSLRLKRHQERARALQLPEEADSSTLLALGQHELRQGHTDIAIAFVNKALQLAPEDKTALVARSKCYLLLGQPRLALLDAETALEPDRNFVRAIFQKAEALYHLGDFEHSLMYYHRGLRLRPELAMFRLGVQKAQEAIENTIGTGIEESCKIMAEAQRARSAGSGRSGGKGSLKARMGSPGPGSSRDLSARRSVSPSDVAVSRKSASPSDATWASSASHTGSAAAVSPVPTSVVPSPSAPGIVLPTELSRSSRVVSRAASSNGVLQPPDADLGDQSSRQLLGELCVDKLYLEQLLKHPDIKCAHRDRSSHISTHAEDGVEFLRNRQEFWRQQKLSTGRGGVAVGTNTHSRSARRHPLPPRATPPRHQRPTSDPRVTVVGV